MISIIIPVYNAENGLKRMLDSILAQTYTDYECLLIDDGSTDASGGICREYEKADRRFRCISQENQGVSAARNHGMALSKGEYITFLDADDQIPPHYLKTLLHCCQSGDIAVCDVAIIEGTQETFRFTHEDGILTQTEGLNGLLTRKRINSGPCAKLFRREILSDLRFPDLRIYEDILFVKDAFARANRIVISSKTEYLYFQNSNSAMHKMAGAPPMDVVTATRELISFLKTRNDLSPMCMYITVSHLFQYVKPIINDKNASSQKFVRSVRALYRKHWKSILHCAAFPWKEKILFLCFAYGMDIKHG